MKRLLCFALAAVLLMGLMPMTASADSADPAPRTLAEGEVYQEMTTSDEMVDMIKKMEGFSRLPYWDVSQWSIGYGSCCGTDRNDKPNHSVTEAEAEQMLIDLLKTNYGSKVNDFMKSIRKQPTQQQFDALVSFTYNLGDGWTKEDCRLVRWLKSPTTEIELVNAMGAWCGVGGKINYGICVRRVQEANVFLHGLYDSTPTPSNYSVVIFRANGGTFADNSKDESVHYYADGASFESFPEVSRKGYTLTGWQVTRERNSKVKAYTVTADSAVWKNLEVTAVWTKDEVESSQPTEPSETTKPTQPTEPSETTQPTQPTEPSEPTEPSQPEETQPTETEPPETEPVELPFTDVPADSWYRGSVEYVYRKEYMNGMGDNQFLPNGSMTRGMLVTVLYRIAGSPEVTEEERACFTDTQNQYYTDPVAWAKREGIVNGMTETTFCPNNKVTRQDAVTIFYRYCVVYLGLDGTAGGDLSGYSDAGKIASYAVEPVQWAVGVGLVQGSQSGGSWVIEPKSNLTRAQAATLLMRFVEELLPAA